MEVFISHSSKDKEIVEYFVDLFINVGILRINNIFSSSTDGARIQSGENWRDSIKTNLFEANIIFLFISDNYKNSEICQNEMGAAWMTNQAKIFPLAIEPITFKTVGILQEVNQLENLLDEGSLERIKDDLSAFFGTEIRSDRWNTKKKEFINKVRHYKENIQPNLTESFDDVTDKLLRGGFTNFLVDSSLTHSQSLNNIDLNKELINDLQNNNGKSIDLKFNYLGSLCASNWIRLSTDPLYGHAKLIEEIKKQMDEIFYATKFSSESYIDFISLGPGDGEIDKYIIHSFQKNCHLANYYPLDLSFELLQKATFNITQTSWLEKVNVKAIHGDFTELINYKPVYGYDQNRNFISLIGFTFGDFNEGELLGKISEGMNKGDYLLIDARLHDLSLSKKVTATEKEYFIANYKNNSNHRFAFGPIESVTVADFNNIKFDFDVRTDITVVPDAVNVVTYCENINTKFRHDNKTLKKTKINLTSTTFYKFEKLEEWISQRNFEIIWRKKIGNIGLLLLEKS